MSSSFAFGASSALCLCRIQGSDKLQLTSEKASIVGAFFAISADEGRMNGIKQEIDGVAMTHTRVQYLIMPTASVSPKATYNLHLDRI
jgi:hypothetical protein